MPAGIPDASTFVSTLRPGPRFSEWEPVVPAMIVSDVDGTFIDDADEVSERIAAATTAALAAGIRFSFATGRLPKGLPAFASASGLFGPHIVHNGAQIVGDHAVTFPLSKLHADGLVAFCLEAGLYAELYTDDGFWITLHDDRARASWDLISGPPLGLVSDAGDVAFTKATVLDFEPGAALDVVSRLTELGIVAEESTAPIFPGSLIVNATAPATSKGTSLRWLSDRLGVDLAAVTAIGDGINDVSMLSIVGTAVAIDGAPPEVLQHAHFLAGAPGDHGVADVLDWALSRL